MSSSFYIESLIQSSKPKTSIAETRHSFEPTVPCSCCWTPSQSEASGLCQLCIPPSSAVHPFLHVRGASIPDANSLYSKEFLKAEHAHLSSHYPTTEEDRLRLVSYGNYLFFYSQFDTLFKPANLRRNHITNFRRTTGVCQLHGTLPTFES